MKQYFAISLFVSLVVQIATESTFPLGGNLPGIVDYSMESVFVDQIKASRVFGRYSAPYDTTNMTYDANGWPTKDFGTYVFTTDKNVLPDTVGVWYVRCTGWAKIAIFASPATVLNQTYHQDTNMTEAYINVRASNTSNQLAITFMTNGTGARDIHIIRPGYDINTHPKFVKAFLDDISNYNTFRFMDWGATNGNPVTRWEQRNSPSTAQYTNGKGVAWEDVIDLCNTANTNAWVNVPAMADDNYVLNMAQLFYAQLNANLVVYVEYSNEVWNYGFSQATYNLNLATSMVNNGTWGPVLNYDGVNNPGYWAWRRTALRAMQISNIWRSVWGDCNMNRRVRVVLAGQVVQPITISQGLAMINALYGPPSNFIYATAGAPYFNLGSANNNNSLTEDDVLNALSASISKVRSSCAYDQNVGVARYYNMKFLGYEGGPDTFGPNSIQAKKQASLDSRIIPLIKNYMNIWYQNGAELFNWFTIGASNYDTQYGTWGVTNDQTNQNAPKILALRQVQNTALPDVVVGNVLPGIVMAGNSLSSPSANPWRYMDNNSDIWYLVNVPKPVGYEYQLSFNFSATRLSTFDVYLNNKRIYTVMLNDTKGKANWTSTYLVRMGSGLNTIRLVSTTPAHGPFQLYHLQFVVNQALQTPDTDFAYPPASAPCPGDSSTGSSTGEAKVNDAVQLSFPIAMLLLGCLLVVL